MVERGIKAPLINYYDRSHNILLGADFNGLIGKTRFPFYVLLPQPATEEVLSSKLKEAGVPILTPYKVVDMRENPNDGHAVDVKFENGQSITAQYVIGADGSQSAVRALFPRVLVRC